MRCLSLPFLLLFLAFLSLPATAAAPPEAQAATPPAAATPPDPLGRTTPRSTVSGLIGALAEHDYDRAAQYFVFPDNSHQRIDGAARARHFQTLLDNGGSLLPYFALSNEAGGRLDDELPLDQERVGEIKIEEQAVAILLVRAADGGREVWRVAPETVGAISAALPRATAPAGGTAVQAQPAAQDGLIIGGAPLKDWALLLGTGALIFGGLWLLSSLAVALMRRMVADSAANGLVRFCEAALPPLSLLIAVGIFYGWAEEISVAIVARQTLLRYTGIVSVVALVWFGLRLVDAIAELAIARMQRHQRRQVVSVITLARRSAKFLLLTFSVVAILDTFGIDVSTGIAALGLGGIALALGAQKTVENLVGSVTVIADRPAQVGDFVKACDVVGTVEDVGIRSTRIRTGERSVVTIPNGDLSARQIENFAPRDRFLFNPLIAVNLATASARLREAVAIVQGVLHAHPKIAKGARANLAKIGERSFDIEVFSYIDVREFDAYVLIREELLLSIYEGLEAAGIGLAFPAQTLLLAPERIDALAPPEAPGARPPAQSRQAARAT